MNSHPIVITVIPITVGSNYIKQPYYYLPLGKPTLFSCDLYRAKIQQAKRVSVQNVITFG